MTVPPGRSAPERSASSIILTAMRSLMELPGLNVSSLTRTSALTSPRVIRLIRTIGVPPTVSRMESQIFFTRQCNAATEIYATAGAWAYTTSRSEAHAHAPPSRPSRRSGHGRDGRRVAQPAGACRRTVASDQHRRQGLLVDDRRLFRTRRLLSVRQPHLERDGVSAGDPRAPEDPASR